jgi:putative transposase
MPRQPRHYVAGIPAHVIQRGNNRLPCFFVESDYRCYLDWLAEAADRFECQIHAYVLMTNHVHLLMTPLTDGAISRVVQSVGRRYVRYINDARQRTGTLWEGRHKGSVIQSERYFLACSRYIELNPVRAGIVARPGDYPWSSYRHNAHGVPDELLTPHIEYTGLGTSPDQRTAAYRALFSNESAPALLDKIRHAIHHGLPAGDQCFKNRIEKRLGRRVMPGKRGRPGNTDGGRD